MKALKNIIIYTGDLLSITIGFYLGFFTIRGFKQDTLLQFKFFHYFIMLIMLFSVIFIILRYYKDSLFNFDSFAAITLGMCIFFVYTFFYVTAVLLSIDIGIYAVITGFIFSCFLCGSYRVCIIAGRKTFIKYVKTDVNSEKKRIIIMGAGEAGKFLADMLAYDREKKMNVVAFVDDDPQLHGRKIKGYPVVGGRKHISAAVKKYNADEIIIAIPHVDNSNFREIVNLSYNLGCRVRRFANMSDLNITDLSKATINDIDIEDLLGREPIKLDLKDVSEMLKNKVIMVTGGAGSIGSEICQQILCYGIEKLIIFDMNENGLFKLENKLNIKHIGKFVTVIGNINNKARLDEVIQKYKPNIIFHAAAYKHVPMMECNPIEAISNNVFGTNNVMVSAIENNVESFTLISTDKAVNPSNIMGASKRLTELLSKYMSSLGTNTKFSVVRFGNVLGSNGSVIPIFEEQIRKGGPVTVTDKEIQRYFMTIPEAVQLVLEATSISKGGELFVLDMGKMIKIYDLATTMIRLSGLEPEKDIKIKITGLRPG